MDRILDVADAVLGLSLSSEQLDYGHMAARAMLMYVLLIAIVRCGKKRFLGRASAFDTILLILVGSIAARALTGGSPYFPSVLGVAVLVAMHWLFSAMSRSSPAFSHLIKGHSTVLVQNGEVVTAHLRSAHISDDDLREDLREHGIDDPTRVKEARLERSGRLSVVKSGT